MKTYLADSEEDGIEFTHGFDAESWAEAEEIAKKYGWLLLCELDEEPLVYTLELEPQVYH